MHKRPTFVFYMKILQEPHILTLSVYPGGRRWIYLTVLCLLKACQFPWHEADDCIKAESFETSAFATSIPRASLSQFEVSEVPCQKHRTARADHSSCKVRGDVFKRKLNSLFIQTKVISDSWRRRGGKCFLCVPHPCFLFSYADRTRPIWRLLSKSCYITWISKREHLVIASKSFPAKIYSNTRKNEPVLQE